MKKEWKIYHSEEIDESFSRGKLNLLQYSFIQQCLLSKKGLETDYIDRSTTDQALMQVIPMNVVEELLNPKVEVFGESIPWFVKVSEDKESRRIYFEFHPDILPHFEVRSE